MHVNSTIRHGELSEMNIDIFIREKGILLRQTDPSVRQIQNKKKEYILQHAYPECYSSTAAAGRQDLEEVGAGPPSSTAEPASRVCAHDALRRYKARKTAVRRWCSSAPLDLRRRTRCGGGYALRPPQPSREPPTTETHRYRKICVHRCLIVTTTGSVG